jgi:hypothetical protein
LASTDIDVLNQARLNASTRNRVLNGVTGHGSTMGHVEPATQRLGKARTGGRYDYGFTHSGGSLYFLTRRFIRLSKGLLASVSGMESPNFAVTLGQEAEIEIKSCSDQR